MMWLEGEPLAAIAILASLMVAGLTAMVPLTGPIRETLIIDADGVRMESLLQGKKAQRALGAAPRPNLRVDVDGTKGVIVIGDAENAFGRLVRLTAEQARWIAAAVERRRGSATTRRSA